MCGTPSGDQMRPTLRHSLEFITSLPFRAETGWDSNPGHREAATTSTGLTAYNSSSVST